ncbi:MAG TPA: hypothetical protein VFQ54_02160 [Thermomicrobiales bacterium]|nr:hypothetical protein [Thermomicrobiales bacterium]
MTLTPEQRERYAKIAYDAHQSWWNSRPETMLAENIPWEEAHEVITMDYPPMVEAVALAAQRDLIERMKEYYQSGDAETYAIWGDILEWLDSYVPAEAAHD